MTRIVAAAALLIAAGVFFLTRGSDDRPAPDNYGGGHVRACLATPTCGSKDGKRKEYRDACAAEDDGASDIRPMRGPTCNSF